MAPLSNTYHLTQYFKNILKVIRYKNIMLVLLIEFQREVLHLH
jgi:hypothetical protein